MRCPDCESENTLLEGVDEQGLEFYECLDCGGQFDETEVDND